MDAEAVDEFSKHYAVVRELFDRLPSVRDDAEVYRLTWAELKKHLARLEELSPPATEPL